MLLERMVAREGVCLRRLGEGRADHVRFGRFVANRRVTVDRLIEGWSDRTAAAAAGRHVLAIQDSSEFNFATTAGSRRGLGEIGKGVGRGALAHVMLAVDAADGACLGLVSGRVWTRPGRVSVPHHQRPLSEKESERWLSTAEAAKTVLCEAASVTVIADRESDIYAEWARVPSANFHLLTRVQKDRRLAGKGKLYAFGAALPAAGTRQLELRARPGRPKRTAELTLRFGCVEISRPQNSIEPGLPKTVGLSYVEAVELDPPGGCEPLHWRLLTTHPVSDAEAAWQIVDWYAQRWLIEQLFRLMKQQGLKVEDSQIATADRLIKLIAIAAKAACLTLQLVQARDGDDRRSADLVFCDDDIAVLEAANHRVEGRTALQKNPHHKHSLAWASWIIARLGGWDGYPSSKPPGPITFRNGIEYFRALATGWSLKNVCMP
ncbi:MAG: IS4 family transposase [Burkholderiales bacterium]